MSVFILNKKHIDAMLSYWCSVQGEYENIAFIEKQGRQLVIQNYRSVNCHHGGNTPPPVYTFERYPKPLTPAAIIKLCECYDRQSCETDDYWSTDAYRISRAIKAYAIYKLLKDNPDYHATPWGIED